MNGLKEKLKVIKMTDTFVYNNDKKLGYVVTEDDNTFTAYYNYDEEDPTVDSSPYIDCNDSQEGFSNKEEAIKWIVENADK